MVLKLCLWSALTNQALFLKQSSRYHKTGTPTQSTATANLPRLHSSENNNESTTHRDKHCFQSGIDTVHHGDFQMTDRVPTESLDFEHQLQNVS